MNIAGHLNRMLPTPRAPMAIESAGMKSATKQAAAELDLTAARDTFESSHTQAATQATPATQESDSELRKAFQDFVGQTLFGSMLESMRKTVGKPAYLHGGRTEEVFQKQLDQTIVEELSDSTAKSLSDPMFELFHQQRRS